MPILKGFLSIFIICLLSVPSWAAPMTIHIRDGDFHYLIDKFMDPSRDVINFTDDNGRNWHTIYNGPVDGIVLRPGAKIDYNTPEAKRMLKLLPVHEHLQFSENQSLIFQTRGKWALTEVNPDLMTDSKLNIYVFADVREVEQIRDLDFSASNLHEGSIYRAVTYQREGQKAETVIVPRVDSPTPDKAPVIMNHIFHPDELELVIKKGVAQINGKGPKVTLASSSNQQATSANKTAQGKAKEPAVQAVRKVSLPSIPDLKVKDDHGEQTDAWKYIQSFSRNLVEDAIQSGETYTDDPELREIENQILRNLLKAEGGSVKVLAPAGVGKTMLIKRLMARIAKGDAPESILKYRFMGFSASSLGAGSRYVGTTEARVEAMIEMSRELPIIWIADEAHSLVGTGTHSNNSSNIFQTMKPELASGILKMVFLSTPDEWSTAFAADPALDRRFGRVDIAEPNGERLRRIQRAWLAKFKKPNMSDQQLDEVTRLSNEFSSEGAQPSRSTNLLAEIFSERELSGETGDLTLQEIHSAAKRVYGIDPAELEEGKRKERYYKLENSLQDLAGQSVAKQRILNIAQRVLVGMQDRSKPRYRLMFAGPKGQGKTEIVKIFAKAMGLPEDNRILMSNFTSPHQVEEMKNQIATYIRRNPFTVLFFDEIEKAHPSIQKALLGILDSGVMTVEAKQGQVTRTTTLRLHNTSVFMATNAGQDYIDQLKDPKHFNESDLRADMERAGLDEFMLDRMEAVIPFFYLTKADFKEVLRIHLNKTINEIQYNRGTQVTIDNMEAMLDKLTQSFFKPKMSNRDALRIVSEALRNTVTQVLFNDGIKSKVDFTWNGQELEKKKSAKAARAKQGPIRCERVHRL